MKNLLVFLLLVLTQILISQPKLYLSIQIEDQQFLIIDSKGRKVGFDATLKARYRDIPYLVYSDEGLGSDDEETGQISDYKPLWILEFRSDSFDSLFSENYTIIIQGEKLNTYLGSIYCLVNDKEFSSSLSGVIDSSQVVSYKFTYSSLPDKNIDLSKDIVPTTLRQDFDNSFKLKLIGEQKFYKELSNHLDNYEKHLAKKDSLKAAREVEKFQSRIRKEYLEAEGKDKRFVTRDGWEILNTDAQYVIGHLVRLPPKPSGTLLQQIDELKAELTRQSNKKNIGGVLLVKSLIFLADQAKKQLQKPLPLTNDSATAALSIAAFQLFVDEVWELTDAISGKSKKLPALYVYDEAYIQLHYRAKYILEELPAPRTLIDMKSVQMDDETKKEFDAMQKMTKEQ